MSLSISALWRYPLKSAAGATLDRAHLDTFGLHLDRRWMLIGPDRRFLSQRRHPKMALLDTTLSGQKLTIHHRGEPAIAPLTVIPPGPAAPTCRVQIWEDPCTARLSTDNAHRWFSAALDHPCRLVFMPEATHRPVDPRYSNLGDRAAFSDGFPLLVISEASLADLNHRLKTPVAMDRFRPNIVVAGSEPYAEDTWRRFTIGDISFDVVKPCSRCLITTTNQQTGTRSLEPLRTLATYRLYNQKVMFGQNVIHRGTGNIAIGDTVEVIERGPGLG